MIPGATNLSGNEVHNLAPEGVTDGVLISAVEGIGLKELIQKIEEGLFKASPIVSNTLVDSGPFMSSGTRAGDQA